MRKNANHVSNFAKQTYEASVKFRALNRAGGNPNLNGHILEIMGSDQTNLNPLNWARGVKQVLTKKPNAKVVDAVIMKGGKIVERIQYKDTAKSISDTIRRVKAGQYNSATLKGTTEAARKFNAMAAKHGITKTMQDTGISSNTTSALARTCGSCKHVSPLRAAALSARSAAGVGAAITGVFSAAENIQAVRKGKKNVGEACLDTVIDTAKGGAASAAGAYTASVVGITLAAAGAGPLCLVALPLVASIGAGIGVSKLLDAIFD